MPPEPDSRATMRRWTPPTVVILVGVLVLAFNLRGAVTSVGAVLAEVTAAVGLTPLTAGILTAMPVLTFGTFAALTPAFVRKFGLHVLACVSVTVAGIGLSARVWTDSTTLFLVLTGVGLCGLAVINVILPSLVKQHFAEHIGMATALYTVAMGMGLSAGAFLTHPIASATGAEGWRWGLIVWGGTALVCVPLWIAIARRYSPKAGESSGPAMSFGTVTRSRLAWLLAGFFGMQSLQAYAIFGWFAQLNRDAGFSAGNASLLLTTVSIASVPAGFITANLAAGPRKVQMLAVLSTLYVVGYLGILAAGTSVWAWVCAVIIGIAQAAFPVVLALIGLKALSVQGTAALSAFTQSVGYAFAAVGPFGMGLLYDWFETWTVAMVVLSVLAVAQFFVAWAVVRQPPLETQLAMRET